MATVAGGGGRPWRTAFLTLRDETDSPPPPPDLLSLLRSAVFSHSPALLVAARDLPPHEVWADLMLLVELVGRLEGVEGAMDAYVSTLHLIHDVDRQWHLEVNLTSWLLLLGFLEEVVRQCFCCSKSFLQDGLVRMNIIREVLDVLRNYPSTEREKLFNFLLLIISYLQSELSSSSCNTNQQYITDSMTKVSKGSSIWEILTVVFSMVGDILSKMGHSVSQALWFSMIKKVRNIMETLLAKGPLVEVPTFSRFYAAVLQCFHIVLSIPKSSISDQVAGYLSLLQRFFTYGLSNGSSLKEITEKQLSLQGGNSLLEISDKKNLGGRYRPPHLRKRDIVDENQEKNDSSFPTRVSSEFSFASSDSEHSDTDGSVKDSDKYQSSKVRLAALMCVQDISQADPKTLTACLSMLLPTNDMLQSSRKGQATLLSCLLFDPYMKIRITCASVLTTILDGSSTVCRQVAEFKETAKHGSFTTLSGTLGQILMQLHSGLLFLVKKETHTGLLISLFKVMTQLISTTPYFRMPEDLLPRIISTLHGKTLDILMFRTEQAALLGCSLSCLSAALSASPPSLLVADILEEQRPSVAFGSPSESRLLPLLFQLSQQLPHSSINYEAFQALRAAFHNYPNVMTAYWEQTSSTVTAFLHAAGTILDHHEGSVRPWRGETCNTSVSTEKCLMVAIKALDECLRAASGFKGADGLAGDELLDTPFLFDFDKTAKISSAPCHGLKSAEISEKLVSDTSAVQYWSWVVENHLPLALKHKASLVRAASVTCFAGLTSNVYFLLEEEKQNFVISSIIRAAMKDESSSVRSAACRAIGIISCFKGVFESAATIDGFVHAVEINASSSLLSVRITASWALANICDAFRNKACYVGLSLPQNAAKANASIFSLLARCALRFATDNDKVKSNAVRALGNLSRFVNFKQESNGDVNWLEPMVQAFVSCVTTGNVKVQWNVCHSLGYLFLNETLTLQDMSWASSLFSILLLLVRTSTNFKIRINAAAALAVPKSRLNYGNSFADVVQSLVLILENFCHEPLLEPSSFKYKAMLERQLTATNLHVIGLASSNESQPIKDFLIKKGTFLEDWLRTLCSSLSDERTGQLMNDSTLEIEKKTMILAAMTYLLDIYRSCGHQNLILRFESLVKSLS